MPQLDIYNFFILNLSVIIVFLLLYNFNIYTILLNIFFWLNIVKLKNYVEKQLMSCIWEELFVRHNVISYKKILIGLYFSIKNIFIIFIELLDVFSYNIKLLYIILQNSKYVFYNKINSKNNIELHRILI